MIRFGLKALLFLILVGGPALLVMSTRSSMLQDRFYWKVTSPGSSLIIGNSQPGEGINPAILEESLQLEGPMINIAFDGANSPYGAPYLEFIKRKLRWGTREGLFILGVSPDAVSDFHNGYGRREEQCVYFDLWSVNMHPNIEFMLRTLGHNHSLLVDMLQEPEEYRNFTNHRNGWCEVTVKHMKPKPKFFRPGFELELLPSDKRLGYLGKTIDWLEERGEVVLVRMPIVKGALEHQEKSYPGFSQVISELADEKGVLFLDYSDQGEDFILHDHSIHLESRGAKAFTKLLARDIKAHQKSK